MYKKRDLQITTPQCFRAIQDQKEDGFAIQYCWYCSRNHSFADSRSKNTAMHPVVSLPHSCDHWVIGGPEEIESLITDLHLALKAMKSEEEEKGNARCSFCNRTATITEEEDGIACNKTSAKSICEGTLWVTYDGSEEDK